MALFPATTQQHFQPNSGSYELLVSIANQNNYLKGLPSSLSHSIWGKNRCITFKKQKKIMCSQQRRTPNFQPTSWSYDFMESIANSNNHLIEIEEENVKNMEVEIGRMLDHNEGDDVEPLTLLELVDDIDRLGLGYKFEEFINRALERVKILQSSQTIGNNLHACALYFRLLRQHGYHISGKIKDMFERFKNSNNRFMASISKDIRGMLSLYEASHLAFDGENTLDEAKEFTSFHLNNIMIADVDNKFGERVRHDLELPFHHRMPRLEARWNIEMYEYHNQNVTNQMLHKLAILDFNKVQFQHQHELQEVARWWRGVGIANKLSFARDRVMECFFWGVGMVFEPEFSKCRVGLAKVGLLITVLDDIYDVYGSAQELQQFTQAVEKWDINAVNHLPNYMKLFFLALYNTVNDLAYQTLKEQDQLIIYQLRKGWADLCRSFLREAKWSHTRQIPKFDEYLNHGWTSSSGIVLLTHAYFLITPTVTDDSIESLNNGHGLLRFSSTVFRLANDLSSSKEDIEKGEVAKAISCYMHETGSSEEAARAYIKKLIDQNWKLLNKEITYNAIFGNNFIRTSCNLARIAMCQYQYGDAHTTPSDVSRNRVKSVIVEPIQLVKIE